MLGNRKAYRSRQLIGVTLDERLESLMGIQLRIQFLGNGGIEHIWRLVATGRHLTLINHNGTSTFLHNGQVVSLINDDTVLQTYIRTEAAYQDLGQQRHIMLLQVLAEEPTRYLQEYSPAVFVKLLEDDWLEPGFILLLRDVTAYQTEAVVPKRLWSFYHAA